MIELAESKIESSLAEINDIQHEHQDEKENLLNSIRDQNQELDFYKKVIEIILSEDEMNEIKKRTKHDIDSDEWIVPMFSFQDKQIMLPILTMKIPG